MIEPTESGGLARIGSLRDSMPSIRREIDDIVSGRLPKILLCNSSPHTMGRPPQEKWDLPP
jgi:glycine dehydrogenase